MGVLGISSNEAVAVKTRLLRTLVLLAAVWPMLAVSAAAQFKTADPDGAPLGEAQAQRWKAGLVISAPSGPCMGIVGTAPVPGDWPEQMVKIVGEEITPGIRVTYGTVLDSVKQMRIEIPYLPAGQEAQALVTFEVRRSSQLAPEDTDVYQVPEARRIERSVRPYLAPSPAIESNNNRIKSLAREVLADGPKGWRRVEAIYDWVRDNVEYDQSLAAGEVRGAVAALTTKKGDCEDMSSLFIALCRADGIPARTVWIPEHCYPEFYLVDAEGKGHWFPCQVSGTRAFGEMPDHRPVLQKGDNFRRPENPRERVRYLSEYLTAKGGQPKVQFVREHLPN